MSTITYTPGVRPLTVGDTVYAPGQALPADCIDWPRFGAYIRTGRVVVMLDGVTLERDVAETMTRRFPGPPSTGAPAEAPPEPEPEPLVEPEPDDDDEDEVSDALARARARIEAARA